MSFRKYAEYKEIGVAWLGEVPEHWEVKRLKFCVQLTDQKMKADREKPLPYVGLENIQSWTGKLLPIDPDVVPTSAANRFGKGMTLFGKLRPYLAKACNPDFEGLCSTELLVFKSTGFDRRLLLYLLLTDGFIKTVDSSTYGAKMPRANWDFIGSCIVPVPPLEEQKQIAAFLDKETTKIDALVDKQEQLITLLREKRQAIISHAVTRGLNPNVKMKESEIEWLGEVPEHWEVSLLKWRYQVTLGKMLKSKQTSPNETEEFYLRAANIQWRGVDTTDVKRMWFTEAEKKKLKLYRDDLLVSEGGDVGRSSLWNEEIEDCYIQNSINRIRARENADTRFLYYWMYFIKHVGYIDMICNKATIAHFTVEKVGATPCVYPPLEEQKQIIAFLDKETTKIDTLIEKCETAIELLKERRTALISAAVTGKIDVRNVG